MLHAGLLLANTRQANDSHIAFLYDVDELSCYSWCAFEPSCVAVDYNKISHSCFYHTETSCEAHEPALDHCCNHYKKHIAVC